MSPESIKAYHSTPDRSSQVRRIYRRFKALPWYGVTTDEAAAYYNLFPNQVSPHMTKFKGLGIAIKTHIRRKTRTGSSAAVLVLNPNPPQAAIDWLRTQGVTI